MLMKWKGALIDLPKELAKIVLVLPLYHAKQGCITKPLLLNMYTQSVVKYDIYSEAALTYPRTRRDGFGSIVCTEL